MTAKIRIRMGNMELEYEGGEEFLKAELKDLLTSVSELHRSRGNSSVDDEGVSDQDQKADEPNSGKPLKLTSGSIAAKLNAQSGSDLALAAAAHLTLVKKQESFPRKDLLNEMKSATAYYNKNYSANLTRILKVLLHSDKFTEPSKSVFALTPAARKDLRSRLANA